MKQQSIFLGVLIYLVLTGCASYRTDTALDTSASKPVSQGLFPERTYLSGIYHSNKSEYKIIHEGEKITGYYRNFSTQDFKGEIWGKIQGDTVRVEFYDPSGATGSGEFKLSADGSEWRGTWKTQGLRHKGKWNLTRVGPLPGGSDNISVSNSTSESQQSAGIDLSGTYVSDRLSKTGWALKKKARLHIYLKQSDNSIEGKFTNDLDGGINGTINGDKLELTWWVSGRCGNGTGELTITSANPVLKGVLICRSQGMQRYDVVFKPN